MAIKTGVLFDKYMTPPLIWGVTISPATVRKCVIFFKALLTTFPSAIYNMKKNSAIYAPRGEDGGSTGRVN